MPKRKRAKQVLGSLTDRELKIIELRTSGMKPGEIARQAGVSPQAIYAVICRIYKKAGLDNTALLTHWAIKNALDEPARVDLPEEIPDRPKKRGTKLLAARV
jgi:DNA-binding NarL/FixJ family response regulator